MFFARFDRVIVIILPGALETPSLHPRERQPVRPEESTEAASTERRELSLQAVGRRRGGGGRRQVMRRNVPESTELRGVRRRQDSQDRREEPPLELQLRSVVRQSRHESEAIREVQVSVVWERIILLFSCPHGMASRKRTPRLRSHAGFVAFHPITKIGPRGSMARVGVSSPSTG